MFGLGKKKEPAPAAAETKAEAASTPAAIPDDKFIVMPSQYLPAATTAPAPSSGKKVYLLAGGGILFLLLAGAGAYFFLLPRFSPPPAPAAEAPGPAMPESAPPAAPVTEESAPRRLESQAYSSTNQLVGALRLSIPRLVDNKYGQSLGITVLSPADVSLPAGTETTGGFYSLYPVGVAFEEPITLDISAVSLTAPESRQDYYPAVLAGASWQEAAAYQTTGEGWTFTLTKFPPSPLTLARRAPAGPATSTTPVIDETRPRPSADTDGDGLTDKEEVLLGANPAQTDTDGDTYPDKSEITSGYSPLAPQEKLEASKLFALYTNPTYGYKVNYPAKWLADALDQTNKQVLFISETEEFFEVLVEDNPLQKPIVDWYRSQSPSLSNVPLDVSVLDREAAVWSPDGLTLYTGKNGLIYIITYNKGTLESLNWPNLYTFFYQSFRFGNSGTSSATSSPPAP